MSWTKRIILCLLLPVVALVAVVAIVQASSHLKAFARQVESILESTLGREIKIAGGIDANLFSLNPSVVLKDVTIANAQWATQPEMAHVARIKIETRLWPIFIGEIQPKRIVAEGARIWLESRPDGRVNWIFKPAKQKSAKPGDKPKPFQFGQLRIVGANIVHSGGPGTPETRASILALSVGGPTPGTSALQGPTVVNARGAIDGLAFEIKARTETIRGLFASKGGAISLSAKLGKSDLTGELEVAPGERLAIKGRLTSKRIAFGKRAGGKSAKAPRAKPKRPKDKPNAGAAKPKNPTPIPISLPKFVSLDIAFTAGRVELPQLRLAKVSGTLTLDDGKLAIKPARATLIGSTLVGAKPAGPSVGVIPLAGSLSLDTNASPARLFVSLATGRIAAKNLKTAAGGPVIAHGQLTLALRAVSTGDTLKALSRRIAATVTAKLANASVIDLPWRPKGSRTAVPKLDVTLTTQGIVLPTKARRRPAPKRKPVAKRKSGARSKPRVPARSADTGAALAGLARLPMKIRLAGVFGRSDIAGTLKLRLGARTSISGALVSRQIDLGGSAGANAGKGGGKRTGKIAGKGRAREPLFGPDPLPIGFIRSVEGSINYRIARAKLGNMAIPNIVSTITLRRGVMRIRSSGAGADSAHVSLVMDARRATTVTALTLRLDDSRLASVLAGKAGLKIPRGTLSLRVNLRGTGNTLRATMAGANGRAVFVMRTPEAEKGKGLIAGLGSGLIGTVSSLVTQRGGPLRCIVARIPIAAGIGKSDILLIDTERLSFFGTSTINLRSETVKALFVPRQKAIGLSRIKLFTVKVAGPIDQPKASLDFGSAAFETAKSAIKIVWLPVKLLGNIFKGKFGEALNFDPCPIAIKRALGQITTK